MADIVLWSTTSRDLEDVVMGEGNGTGDGVPTEGRRAGLWPAVRARLFKMGLAGSTFVLAVRKTPVRTFDIP